MRKKVRRLAVLTVLVFVVASATLHFTLGSAVTKFFPSWRSQAVPDEAISIISLSHNAREEHTPPPTPPPAPPKIVLRTSTHLAPLKYREFTRSEKTSVGPIHPPARHKSDLIIVGARLAPPGKGEAPAVTNKVQPTPSPGTAGAKADTGGTNDEFTASEWGDDNPPRVIRLQPLALEPPPPQPVRIAVDIDPEGNVVSARIVQSSGDPNLDQLALDAARRTIFAPATLNGLPVHGTIVLEYPPSSGSS
jgi:TonB family protein